MSEWDEIPEGALVMPVDDDDWFVPGAAQALEAERDPDAIGYLWPSRWIQVPINLGHRLYLLRRRLLPRTPPKWICSTNNYAMVKGPEVKEALGNHIEASHWFEGPLASEGPDRQARRRGAEPCESHPGLADVPEPTAGTRSGAPSCCASTAGTSGSTSGRCPRISTGPAPTWR